MTVSTLNFYKVYIAAAAQTVFPYDFMILAAADLQVYDNGTLLALGVDYTVSGAGADSGGNVTFVVGRTADHTILIRRETPRTQATDLNAGQQFYEAVIVAMADKLTLLVQEFPNAQIPLSPAGYYLRIKADGSGIEAVSNVTLGTAMPMDTGSAPPISGTFSAGHFRLRVPAIPGESLGWSTDAGGTPGTWYESGFVSTNPV